MSVEAALRHQGAPAVPILAAAATIVGFVNARRRARIRRVDIPITGLPPALHGFSIAQTPCELELRPLTQQHLRAAAPSVSG